MRSRAIAQNLSQRISKSSWLGELENVTLAHGVSLLRWRSGGFKHPHDTPLNPSCRHQLSPIAPSGNARVLHLLSPALETGSSSGCPCQFVPATSVLG